MDKELKVLLIEDEKDLSDSIKDGLESVGISTLQAFDGKEGLRVALGNKPYLIMLDLYMPVMDGMAFLKLLREDEEYGAGARVIVLTNLADREKVTEATDLNVLDYIIKSNSSIQDVINKVKVLVSP